VNTSGWWNGAHHVANSLYVAPPRNVAIDDTSTPQPNIPMMLAWVTEPETTSMQYHPADAEPDSVDIAHGDNAEATAGHVKEDRVVRDPRFHVVVDWRAAVDILEWRRVLFFESHADGS
jgi:hypothetical protein